MQYPTFWAQPRRSVPVSLDRNMQSRSISVLLLLVLLALGLTVLSMRDVPERNSRFHVEEAVRLDVEVAPSQEREDAPIEATKGYREAPLFYTSYVPGNSMYVMNNLGDRYTHAVGLAEQGDAAAAFDIHIALDICWRIEWLRTEIYIFDQETGLRSEMQRDVSAAVLAAAQPTFDDCDEVRAHLDVDQDALFDLQEKWLQRAAEQGSEIARLLAKRSAEDYFTALTNTEKGASIYADQIIALNAALREGHYAAYYLAAEFAFGWHHPDALAENQLVALSWQYLGCVRHPECDSEGFRRVVLSEKLLPAEIQQVIQFADEFDPTAETFGFERLSLPLHLHSAPLIYPE